MPQIALAGLYRSCPQGQNVNNRKCNLRIATKHNQSAPADYKSAGAGNTKKHVKERLIIEK
jgi:hypothetical protein